MRRADAAFQASVDEARVYERAASAWLRRRGWYVLPTYDYSGLGESKAPKLEAAVAAASLVIPDLLAAKGGTSRFVEVKYKGRADFTRKTQRLETGIDLRLWDHYVRVQRVTGVAVWIAFLHRSEAELRSSSLDVLAPMARTSPNFNCGRGGVFFPWESLQRLASWQDVMGSEAA